MNQTTEPRRRADRPAAPWTLWMGLAIIAIAEAMLALDVLWRGGVVLGPGSPLPEPQNTGQLATRWFAENITPLCWAGYLLAVEGLLSWLARRRGGSGSCVRRRPWLFVACFVTSIPVWCYWDWINFYFMDAWRYYGMPPHWWQRYTGYFLAFGAISPGMFLAAQLWQSLGLARLRTRFSGAAAMGVLGAVGVLGVGLTLGVMLAWGDRMDFALSLTGAALL
ncbi:MAG: hypothetical protein GVY28_08255, partial [Alphaproteobacteria bacterium]|nr:hypothetical protein [Alphaproteobacteria bacterium]